MRYIQICMILWNCIEERYGCYDFVFLAYEVILD